MGGPLFFLPYFCSQDLLGFNEGGTEDPMRNLELFRLNIMYAGVSFVVWAPSMKSVHLVSDFNHWNPVSCRCVRLVIPVAGNFLFPLRNRVISTNLDPWGG